METCKISETETNDSLNFEAIIPWKNELIEV